MEQMQKALEGIGLSAREARVYLALMETGQSTTGPIVKRSGVPASKVYAILDRLMGKGLVSTVTKNGRKYFSVLSPEKIISYIEEKENELKKQKEEMQKNLSYFLEKRKEAEGEQRAEVAMGFQGFVNLANQLVEGGKKGDEYVFFSFYTKDPGKYEKVYNFYREFDKVRKERGLVLKGIVPKGMEEYAGGKRYAKICYVDFPVPTNIAVFKDMILLTPWEDEPVSILIHSRQLAESLRRYFNSVFDKYYR